MEFYRQTSAYTGAAAALLMALHNRLPDVWPLDREKEFSLWLASATLPTRSSSIYALARIAHDEGLPVRVIVEERDYDYPDYRFKRYKKVDIEDAKFSSELHLRRLEEREVPVEERPFDLPEIKRLLTGGNLLVLRLNAGVLRDQQATSRYVLVISHDDKGYHVMDPEQGMMSISDEEMQEAYETLVTKKKREHAVLVIGTAK